MFPGDEPVCISCDIAPQRRQICYLTCSPRAGKEYRLAAAARLGIASLFSSNKEEVAAKSLSPVFPLIIQESYFLFKSFFEAFFTWGKKENRFNCV